MVIKLNQEKKEFIILIILSSIFALTVQQKLFISGKSCSFNSFFEKH